MNELHTNFVIQWGRKAEALRRFQEAGNGEVTVEARAALADYLQADADLTLTLGFILARLAQRDSE